MPLPHRLPRPERGRQVTPRRPGPEPVDDALHYLPVVPERPTTLTVRRRQQRLDPLPLGIAQQRSPRHPPTITESQTNLWETRSRTPLPALAGGASPRSHVFAPASASPERRSGL